MTASTIPDHAITQSYLWQCNAAMAAFNLSESYKTTITAAELKLRWAEMLEHNTPLRLLGERPEMGFKPSDRVKMAKELVA